MVNLRLHVKLLHCFFTYYVRNQYVLLENLELSLSNTALSHKTFLLRSPPPPHTHTQTHKHTNTYAVALNEVNLIDINMRVHPSVC